MKKPIQELKIYLLLFPLYVKLSLWKFKGILIKAYFIGREKNL